MSSKPLKHKPHSVIARNRLECLFDGIFAIAMTILVLDVKVPDLADHHSIWELAGALARQTPIYGSYALSFGMLGLFWYRHNEQFHCFEVITQGMLFFQLIQLATAAFFPFCAGLLGKYPVNPLSIAVYVSCIFICVWSNLGNWWAARRACAFRSDIAVKDLGKLGRRITRSCIVITLLLGFVLTRVFKN